MGTAALTTVLLVHPAAGHAGTVSTFQGEARYEALDGEVNSVTITSPRPGTIVFTESGPGVPVYDGSSGDACSVSGNQVTCTVQSIEILLGDRDDSASAAGADISRVALRGGDGNDVLAGGNGGDSLDGSAGDDTIDGGPGDDGGGNLETNVSCGVDGGPGSDVVAGGDGNDGVCGGTGLDTLRGGNGADTLTDDDRTGSAGASGEPRTVDADVIDGGPGEGDAVLYAFRTRAMRLTLGNAAADDGETAAGDHPAENDTLISIEGAATGPGDDEITGSDAPNLIFGNEGRDIVATLDGRDIVEGGPGDDALDGGDDRDALNGDKGNDVVDGGPGDDGYFHLFNTECFYRSGVTGGEGDDLLSGGAGNDGLCGGGGKDTLLGGDGDDGLKDGDLDRYNYRPGMPGGLDADMLDGGAGSDTVSFEQRVRPVRLTLGSGVADDGAVAGDGLPAEGDSILGVENAILGDAGDEVVGSAADNFVQGQAGADRVAGGEGADVLLGGGGDDVLAGEGGPDGLRGDTGRDDLSGGEGADNMVAADQESDHLACGGDIDAITIDLIDAVDADCERPRIAPATGGPAPGPGPGGPVTSRPPARATVSCLRTAKVKRKKVRIRCRVKTARRGRAVLRRDGRVVARTTIRGGRFSASVPARGGRPRAGRYTLTVASGRGADKRFRTERVRMR